MSDTRKNVDAGKANINFRDQLRQNVLIKQYYCDVDIAHLISYNEELAHKLTTEPADIIPLVSTWSSKTLARTDIFIVRKCSSTMHPTNRLSLAT